MNLYLASGPSPIHSVVFSELYAILLEGVEGALRQLQSQVDGEHSAKINEAKLRQVFVTPCQSICDTVSFDTVSVLCRAKSAQISQSGPYSGLDCDSVDDSLRQLQSQVDGEHSAKIREAKLGQVPPFSCSERRVDNFQRVDDFDLNDKARIWPRADARGLWPLPDTFGGVFGALRHPA